MFRSSTYRSGVIYSVILNILAKGLVFLVNVLIVTRFGAISSTDIYFFIFSLNVLIVAFFNSLSTTVVIPGMFHLGRDDAAAAQGLVSKLYLIFLTLVIAFAGCVYAFPIGAVSLISKFSESQLAQSVPLIRLGLIVLVLQSAVGLLNDLLNAKKYFIMPALIAALNSLVIIVGVYGFGKSVGLEIVFYANIWAFSATLIIQLLILYNAAKWRFKLQWSGSHIRHLHIRNLFLTGLGSCFTILAAYVPLYLFSGETQGQLTSLNMAQRMADIPNSLLFFQFAAVLGIQFNEHAVNKDNENLNNSFLRFSGIIMFISIPVSFLLAYFAFEITSILFGHGSKINTQGIKIASQLLFFLAFATPFIGLNSMVGKLFQSMQKIQHAFLYQIMINVMLIAISSLFFFLMASRGYALGYTISYFVNFLLCYFLLRRVVPFIKYQSVIGNWIKLTALNLVALGVVFALDNVIPGIHGNSWFRVTVGGSTYLAIVLLVNYALSINAEVKYELIKIKKLIFRG